MRYLLFLLATTLSAQTVDWHKQVKNKSTTESYDYIWSRTNNAGASGDLSLIGAGRTITLTPCPKGVNGTDTAHYVYISGGTGTAEAVLITGGTCTSASSSGTIIVTTANTHTGSWAVSTATAGIQEAVELTEASAHPGSVTISCGTHTVYAPTRVRLTNVGIAAASDYCATIDASNIATGNVFEFHAATGTFENGSIRGLKIYASSKTSGAAISVGIAYNFHADKIVSTNIPDGIVFTASYLAYVTDVQISGLKATTGRGISYDGGANLRIDKAQISGDTSGTANQPLAGVEILDGGGIWLTDVDVIGCGKDLYIHPGAAKSVSAGFVVNSSFDTATYGVYIEPTSTGTVYYWNFANSWTASHTQSGVYVNAPAAAQVDNLSFDNHRSVNNQRQGFFFDKAQNVSVADSQVWGNSQVGVGAAAAIQVSANLNHFQLIGNMFTPPGAFPKNHAAHISVTAGTGDYYTIAHNDLSDTISVAPIIYAGTGTHNIIRDNVGADTFINTVASATTLSLTNLPGMTYFVTGTTAVTTIQNGWEGRAVTFVKNDAGSVAFNTGGNIASAVTLALNGTITCRYASSSWYCK